MHRFAGLTLAVASIFCCSSLRAQSALGTPKDTVRTPADSEFHMTKSPLEAVLLSAVIPGAGQVYLDQAWKLPILYGLAGAFFYGAIVQNNRYHWAQDSVSNRYARLTATDSTWAHAWESSREFYRDDRDKWWIYLGLTYIANLLDAYVSANLYDFDVSNPSPAPFESYYDPIERRVTLSYTLRF